ncbi:ABC transporter permease [Glycomyces sp. NPDC047369]
MSSISPHPDGVSGPAGNRDGSPDPTDAAAPQGGFGAGPSAAPAGYPPGAMSSGSAAFASPPPSAAPGITPPPHPGQPGQAPAAPQAPQGYAPQPGYNPAAPQHPGAHPAPGHPQAPPPAAYGSPQQPYGAPQAPYNPGQSQQSPQPQHPGQPQHQTPPPPHPGQQPPPPPPGYGQQPGQPPQPYGQPAHFQPQTPPPPPAVAPPPPHVAAGSPGQVPQAPYATRVEPGRDMPMAGQSPIRRNIDDTAELPAFLDSARSDEGPIDNTREAEAKPLKRKFPLTTGFTALLRHRYAMSVLVRRDLAVKYQSTVMGYVWSLIEPLGLTLIYWFVFDLVFGGGKSMPNDPGTPQAGYLIFIVSGIFAYQWFSTAVNQGQTALGGQASLITVMKVPREVFPVSKVFARFAEYLVGFPILIGVALLDGGTFGLNLLWLFPAILVQAMLTTGMVFILAAANVLYKDVSRFMPLVMRVLFYGSAIIYPVSKVAEADTMKEHPWLFDVFSSNPLVGIFSMHRGAFIPELAPNTYQVAVAFGFSVFLLFFGRWIFYKLEPRVLKAL